MVERYVIDVKVTALFHSSSHTCSSDWKTNKPRMHLTGQSDPAPDSEECQDHIYCEHGGLSLNITNRTKISCEVWYVENLLFEWSHWRVVGWQATELLKRLFPTWTPLGSETETCAVCDALVHISKEDKRENRRLVENEKVGLSVLSPIFTYSSPPWKALLKFIYEPGLDSWASGVAHNSFAVVPSHFVKTWRRWVAQPNVTAKPVAFDNDIFFCEHNKLVFDPNDSTDMDSSIVLIQQDEWKILQTV